MQSSLLTPDYFERLLAGVRKQPNCSLETGLAGINGKIRAFSCNFLESDDDADLFVRAGFPTIEAFYTAIYATIWT
jgi:hypothetical protein